MLLSGSVFDRGRQFCFRYSFQAVLYALWRERNRIRHGETPLAVTTLKKLVDKEIRNKLSLVSKMRRKGLEDVLQIWFSTRG